jgi:hypothetical protein
MLVECGFTRAQMPDGTEYTFRPSFARIAALGSPAEIVQIYADLHGPQASRTAGYVLAVLCDQDDPTPLIGWYDAHGWHPGVMPAPEQIILACHLMQHGIVGKTKPGRGGGQYAQEFHAAEYIAAARVHLGLSSADAESLSMTEFQTAFEMKFPEAKAKELPSREEYRELMAKIEGKKRG